MKKNIIKINKKNKNNKYKNNKYKNNNTKTTIQKQQIQKQQIQKQQIQKQQIQKQQIQKQQREIQPIILDEKNRINKEIYSAKLKGGDRFIRLGDWNIGDVRYHAPAKNYHFAITNIKTNYTIGFRSDGHRYNHTVNQGWGIYNKPGSDWHRDLLPDGPTNVQFGDGFIQFGDVWRLGRIDSGHFGLSSKDGVRFLWRVDGTLHHVARKPNGLEGTIWTLWPNKWTKSTGIQWELKPNNLFVGPQIIQFDNSWRIGDFNTVNHFVITPVDKISKNGKGFIYATGQGVVHPRKLLHRGIPYSHEIIKNILNQEIQPSAPNETFTVPTGANSLSECYGARYWDLRAAFGTDKAKLGEHYTTFTTNGPETRSNSCTLSDAEAQCYLDRYSDAKTYAGTNLKLARKHYYNTGMAENRDFTCPPGVTELKCYGKRYPDLQNALGTDYDARNTQSTIYKLGQHWSRHGKGEGRDFSCSYKLIKFESEYITGKDAKIGNYVNNLVTEKLKNNINVSTYIDNTLVSNDKSGINSSSSSNGENLLYNYMKQWSVIGGANKKVSALFKFNNPVNIKYFNYATYNGETVGAYKGWNLYYKDKNNNWVKAINNNNTIIYIPSANSIAPNYGIKVSQSDFSKEWKFEVLPTINVYIYWVKMFGDYWVKELVLPGK